MGKRVAIMGKAWAGWAGGTAETPRNTKSVPVQDRKQRTTTAVKSACADCSNSGHVQRIPDRACQAHQQSHQSPVCPDRRRVQQQQWVKNSAFNVQYPSERREYNKYMQHM